MDTPTPLNVSQRFMVREQLFALGDNFFVEDENGARVYWIDGKALSIGKTLLFNDLTETQNTVWNKDCCARTRQ